MKNKIHDCFDGCSEFYLSQAADLVGLPNLERHYNEAGIMVLCDLEFCEECGWVFSMREGCGDGLGGGYVCPDCDEYNT